MPRTKFSLANLADLDMGKVTAMFEAHLQRVYRDIEDRPDDGRARSINVKFSIKPMDPKADAISVAAKVTSDVPDMETREYEMLLKHAAGKGYEALFHNDNLDDAKQGVLDDQRPPKRSDERTV